MYCKKESFAETEGFTTVHRACRLPNAASTFLSHFFPQIVELVQLDISILNIFNTEKGFIMNYQ